MTRTLPALVAVLALTRTVAAEAPPAPPSWQQDGLVRVREAADLRARLGTAPAPHQDRDRDRKDGRLLFVSRGMPSAELQAALDEAAHDPRLTLVLRGLLPGETMVQALQAIATLLAGHEPTPAMVIDPPAFGRHGIDAVPALVDPATGDKLLGAVVVAALEQARRHHPAPDLERTGPTWAIAEPDLVAVLQARAAALDLPGRAQAAMQRFWHQAPALVLPPALASTIRRVRPVALTANDLIDHRGRVLLPARARLNPLDTLPLTARLLVINAQAPREIAWARRQHVAGRATLVLATNPDRAAGWAGWRALQAARATPVYLLDRQLAVRLDVRATPTLIEAHGPELVLTETALTRELEP